MRLPFSRPGCLTRFCRLLGPSIAVPSQCAVCQGWGDRRICSDCLGRFARPVPRCMRCALAVQPGVRMCGGCLLRPPAFDRSVAAVDYAFPWDRLVQRLKFRDGIDLAASLSALLADALRAATQTDEIDLLLPLPLSPSRLRERGYNQAWELARRLGRALSRPSNPRLLVRRDEDRRQADLSARQRLANVRHAFSVPCSAGSPLQGRRLALIDDVMTTGASASEAARALKMAGASRVELWVLARTPAAAGRATALSGISALESTATRRAL